MKAFYQQEPFTHQLRLNVICMKYPVHPQAQIAIEEHPQVQVTTKDIIILVPENDSLYWSIVDHYEFFRLINNYDLFLLFITSF